MGEYGYMQDGVGLKMVDLDLIVIQHIPKELGGKNAESVKEKNDKGPLFCQHQA